MWTLAGCHLLLLSICEKYHPDQEMPSFICQTTHRRRKFIDRGASKRSREKVNLLEQVPKSVWEPVKLKLGNFFCSENFGQASKPGIFHLYAVLSLISCSPIQSCHYGTLPPPSPGSSPSSSSSSSQSSLDPSSSLLFSSFFPIFQRGKLMLHCHSKYHVCCVIYQN